MKRSPERTQFLEDLITGAIEHSGYGFPECIEYPDVPDGQVYAIIIDRYVEDGDDDYGAQYRVNADVMAKGVSMIIRDVEGKIVSDDHRKQIMAASRDKDASDMDVVDCLAILEVALFGEVIYC